MECKGTVADADRAGLDVEIATKCTLAGFALVLLQAGVAWWWVSATSTSVSMAAKPLHGRCRCF